MKSITALVPMRDTTTWPGYRDARWVPERYAVCGGEALQYDDTRTRWVWNNRASASVDTVLTGGQVASGWTWRNGVDAAGVVVTFIEFSAAVPEGQTVVARGRGALHPVRGNLMESPAEVLWDILANLGGLNLPEARFAAFAQQCAAADLVVGGSIEAPVPLFEIARAICASIGAVCSPDMRGFAQLWPGFSAQAAATVERRSGVTVSATTVLDDICTDLTLRYAIEAGTPRGAVQYVAGDAPSGLLAQVVDAPWISDTRVAALVCERLLAFRARPQWAVSVDGLAGDIRVGQSVAIDHPLLPVNGTHLVLSRELLDDGNSEVSSIALRAPVGAAQLLRMVRNTNASDPLAPAPASVTTTPDEIVILVLDETRQPMLGAECVLDGQWTRFADSAGKVRYPRRLTTPGMHTIVATSQGHPDPITVQFSVP